MMPTSPSLPHYSHDSPPLSPLTKDEQVEYQDSNEVLRMGTISHVAADHDDFENTYIQRFYLHANVCLVRGMRERATAL